MAVFLLNECKFNNCGLCFKNLYDLIQHIEDKHIGKKPKTFSTRSASSYGSTRRTCSYVDDLFIILFFTSMPIFLSLPFSYRRNDLFVPKTALPPPMDLSDPIVQLCIFKFRSFPRPLKK